MFFFMVKIKKKREIISSIIALTERGGLSWEKRSADAERPAPVLGLSGDSVFVAGHGGREFYLFERDGTVPDVDIHVALTVAGPGMEGEWTFPEMDVLEELYDLVQQRWAEERD